MFRQSRNQLSRNLNGLIVITSRQANQACFFAVVRQCFSPGGQLVQQFADFGIRELFMCKSPNGSLLLPACCRATSRHVSALIPAQQGVHCVQIVDFL